MSDRVHVTPAGLARLQAQLEEKRRRHREICAERELAHELSGDGWHDNPHFNHLQQLEANATREVAQLLGLIRRAQVFQVRPGARPTAVVTCGSIVTVLLAHTETGREERRTFEIVGYEEGDGSPNQIAYNVPLAALILGAKVGDCVTVPLPSGEYDVEVLALHQDEPSIAMSA